MINQLKLAAMAAMLPLALSSAHGGGVSINFNLSDLNTYGSSSEAIGDYYNGGTDAGGATGPNYGISFGSDALALRNYPNSNVGNEPDGGYASMIFLSGSGDIMNVAAGFTTGFSFYYAAPFYTGSVSVYSGLNGTGTLLATLALPLTPDGKSSPYNLPYNYGVWDPIGVTFAGTAESVSFSGTANYITFADLTIGSEIPSLNNNVPDNGGMSIYMLAGLGLAGMAWASRKKVAATV